MLCGARLTVGTVGVVVLARSAGECEHYRASEEKRNHRGVPREVQRAPLRTRGRPSSLSRRDAAWVQWMQHMHHDVHIMHVCTCRFSRASSALDPFFSQEPNTSARNARSMPTEPEDKNSRWNQRLIGFIFARLAHSRRPGRTHGRPNARTPPAGTKGLPRGAQRPPGRHAKLGRSGVPGIN